MHMCTCKDTHTVTHAGMCTQTTSHTHTRRSKYAKTHTHIHTHAWFTLCIIQVNKYSLLIKYTRSLNASFYYLGTRRYSIFITVHIRRIHSQDAGKMFGTNVAKPNVEVSMQRHTHIHTHAWFTLLYFKEKIFVVK